ncbi:MAG TPA: ABC transporter ATP-binding protein [Xanthobacteraceae bacterium]|jgi:spermidine/putrescine ABC transporter ATP-binding subunit
MSKATADMTRGAAADVSQDVAVRFEGVSKRFGRVTALHEISLPIRHGEFMTLLGPSGCGKTTVLNLIAGFFSPDGGEIRVDGELVNDVPTYKRQVGMMFQNYALFPHMSVAANIGYGLKARRLPKSEIERRLREVLALVRLTGYEDRRPRDLSGGQQQRVALARALVINPKVLLLDEPFSALDKNLRASMQVELREIQRKLSVTTVFVTHDQSEALSLSDRLAVMSEGRIRQLGTPEEIYRRPCERFVASFVGDTNVLRARIESIDATGAIVALGAARIRVASAPLRDLAVSAAVDLFVRPEQLRLTELNEPCASKGTIVAQVYQGGHVDIYLECADSACGRVLARLSGPQAMTSRSIGAPVGVSLNTDEAIAFAIA